MKIKRIIAAIICALLALSVFSGCSKKEAESTTDKTTPSETTSVKAEDFRITSYVVADGLREKGKLDTSHFSQITDVILFGCATFDEEGKVTLDDEFDTILANLKDAIGDSQEKKVYLNILGPSAQIDSDDWNKRMDDVGERHTKAFESGNLENNIKAVLDKYGFDGIFFDYEYPIKSKHWKAFSKFIVSLDSVLGDNYEVGAAVASWDAKFSDEAKDALDRIELMSYDLWDDDGTHASYEIAQDDINKLVEAGYDKAKIDLGVPFYARPTTQEAIWYNYSDYVDKIDDKGFAKDEGNNLIASFNTYDTVAKKTQLAIDSGLGGMMVWHYACDAPADNAKSLFNAMYNTVEAQKEAEVTE